MTSVLTNMVTSLDRLKQTSSALLLDLSLISYSADT